MVGKVVLIRAFALVLGVGWFGFTGCKSDDNAPQGSSNLPVIPCNNDGQCSPPVPYCETLGGLCVQCLGDPNCPAGETCNLANHTCVRCTTNAECRTGVPYCSSEGQCVQCITAANCGEANQTCDDYRCVPSCNADADCPATMPNRPYCNLVRHVCVQCLGDSNCSPNSPYCETTTSNCVECLTDGNCGDAGVCSNGHRCTSD